MTFPAFLLALLALAMIFTAIRYESSHPGRHSALALALVAGGCILMMWAF